MFTLSLLDTQLICSRLVGIAVAQQSLELLSLRAAWAEGGVWSWSLLRDDFRGAGRGLRLLDVFSGELGFTALLALQVVCALVLTFLAGSLNEGGRSIALGFLFGASLLTAVRWRGSFNGGSDCMTITILSGLTLSSLGLARLGIGLLAVQVGFSFFISGAIKLQKRSWRKGEALAGFLRVSNYGVPAALRTLGAHRKLCLGLSWAVMAFEVLFPLALFSQSAALVFLSSALIFQLVNFYVFGLNRFFFVWAAAYPAIYFFSQR